MEFVKGLIGAAWDRVIVNYKPTLYGLGLSLAAFVVEQVAAYFAVAPDGWAKYVAMVAVPIGAWLRSRSAKYPQPVPPTP